MNTAHAAPRHKKARLAALPVGTPQSPNRAHSPNSCLTFQVPPEAPTPRYNSPGRNGSSHSERSDVSSELARGMLSNKNTTVTIMDARTSRISALLLGIISPVALADSGSPPTKLGDIVQVTTSSSPPPGGDYYVTVVAEPDASATLLPNTCVDQSFWSFVKRFLGANPSSAAAVLTVKITPSSAPGSAISVPVFSTVANSLSKQGTGSNCQTDFVSRPITFTFNSNQNPTFTVDMAFHLANNTTSSVVTSVISQASSLMKLMAGASATPAALVTLADPSIKTLASNIDSAISNNWTNSTDLNFSTELSAPRTGVQAFDRITFKMPALVPSGGGARVGSTWGAGGALFLKYSGEKFKVNGVWQDYSTVLTTTIVPSTNAGSQTNLYSIVLNGTATNGFKLGSLNSSSTQDSLDNACEDLKRFLAGFLVPNDALVGRFAILKGSPYEKLPSLRANSSCFAPAELTSLVGLNAAYTFSQQPRDDAGVRDAKVAQKMAPIRTALLLQNPVVLAQLVDSPPTSFYIALGRQASDYFQGQAAIDKLSQSAVALSCFQARPGHDLSTIAALATYNGAQTAAIASFGQNDKLTSLVLMPPDDVIAATGIKKASWLDTSASTPACAPRPQRLMSVQKPS